MGARRLLLLFLGVICTSSFAASTDDDQGYQAMILDGESIPVALGQSISELSLAAVRDGILEPIPYQIDEYNVGGAVYFDGWDVPLAGTQGVFDPEDKLLFLLKDAGDKRGREPYDGDFVAEIRVKDNSGDTGYRYVYLVRGSRLRAEEQYVRYSADIARVETDFYELIYNRENHLIWEDFRIFGYEGDEPFDTMKIRLGAGVLTSMTQVELNNKHVIAKPRGERIGPIRTITQLEMTLYVLEIPLFTASLQLHHYPKSLLYDLRVIIPEFRRALIVDPHVAVSLDGNGLLGATVYTAGGPQEGAPVDGKMTEQEQALHDAGVSMDKNWFYTSTNKNLDVIAFVDSLSDKEIPMSLVLVDDAETADQPERFKGQLPNFGLRIDDMPMSGLLGFAVSLFVDDKFQGKPARFTRSLRTLPDMEVRSF